MGTTASTCEPPLHVKITKSLLGYGVLAGPFYVTVVAVQAATRAGFDPTHHPASVLANGPLGWIQITNFLLTGAMTSAAGVGVYRALGRSTARWAGVLIAAYGVALVAAGIFRADPMPGFPPGTLEEHAVVSWHGVLHLVSAAIGFGSLIAACFVLAAWLGRSARRRWSWFSGLTGALVIAGFASLASGKGGSAAVLGFTAALVIAWAWLAAISVQLYRMVR
jgi:hypothetical membrane protein